MTNENENKDEKNRWQRYGIKWPRLRHGCKYTKFKLCLSVMTVMY